MHGHTDNQVKSIFTLVLWLILMSFTVSANADSLNTKVENVPEDLKAWVPWVLKDQPDLVCPIVYNNNQHFCAYPGALFISLGENSGQFQQKWEIFAESFIALPGDSKNWPENVIINEQLHPVMLRNGKPFVQLQKGRYSIKGDFYWQQQPKFISIPGDTGLIHLSIDDRPVNLPDFRDGKLWLKTSATTSHQNNRLGLRVFRKLTDSIPLKVETMIKLEVSGQQREIVLEGALLKDFTTSSIISKLPARIDNKNLLKIQLRPGQWSINISSFYTQEVQSISLPNFKKPWPANEIWVVDQQTHLRRFNITGKTSIDANQTQLPNYWKKYPAFQMKSTEQMNFEIIKRGDPQPEPDQLSLAKKIWLDFDGKGTTINDKITGKLSRQWRLNSEENINLGQVTLNGAPQYITRSVQQQQGVEVRHGKLNLSADSRIESADRTLSASGWDIDFNKLDATLYLPAGWKLFSLSGADASSTWIKKWTLLDLFLVLITAIAVFKLWGVWWGLIALLALLLTWHQADAPQFIWINLIIAAALLRALPVEGRVYKFIRNYRFAVMIVLGLLLLPFIVNQARIALYPQLEFYNIGTQYTGDAIESDQVFAESEVVLQGSNGSVSKSIGLSRTNSGYRNYAPKKKAKSGRSIAKVQVDSIDPNAMIQTGPGLPSWTLNRYHIRWDGPVRSDQQITMTLISPAVNSLLNVLRIIFVLLLAWRLLDISMAKLKAASNSSPAFFIPFLLTAMLTGLLSLTPQISQAAFPTKDLIDELRNELNKPAKCLPQCAAIESLSIDLSAQNLTFMMRIHAQQDVSIPLPVPVKQWMPDNILLDGESASGIFRQKSPMLWLFLAKGSHVVEINGRVDYLQQLQISFPLKPHHIRLTAEGWLAEGMDHDVTKISALSLVKINKDQKALSEIEQSEIPVYAQLTRTLDLGHSWHTTTQVRGLWGSSYPVILKIPLLAGESVLSDNIKVENGHAIITLSRNKSSVQWQSKLAITKQIKLKAIASEQLIEQWVLNTSPTWHIEHSGIPVVYHQRQGDLWQPRWQPWPDEQVLIEVTRPEGVIGKTITIDSSELVITPGEQNTAANLSFNLRSSLGGQHTIHLPHNAVLQSVTINNKNMPIRNSKEGLSLPVLPGKQKIKVDWHEVRGITSIFNTSEVNLGSESVNNKITLTPGSKRWILLTKGPAMGPAVLFWGVFGIILILSYGLGRIKGTPLNTLQWVLLWIGLSASEPLSAIVIVACIFALKARNSMDVKATRAIAFNALQILLIVLVVLSLTALIASIQQGLLGSPRMQISGNGSTAYQLNWFSDRIAQMLPEATMISVPVTVYRLIMLAWSIWLAFAVIKWAQWGWAAFSHEGYWQSLPKKTKFRNKSRASANQGKDKLFVNEDDISV